MGVVSEVTGGRAPSFHDFSVGEAPAPSDSEENGGGGEFPSQISHRKDQPGSPWNEGKDTHGPPIQFGCGQRPAFGLIFYLPLNTGFLFSRKAVLASATSSVAKRAAIISI